MSERPTATNQVAAKHWSLTIETMASVSNGQTTDASSAVVPGCLPPVEPELVRSSHSDLSRVTAPTLPQVDAELVRNTSDDLCTPTTDGRHTVAAEVINDSNGNGGGVGIEASSTVEPESMSISSTEPAAVTAASLPLTEPESVSNCDAQPAAVTADPLPLTEPQVRSSIVPLSGPTTEWNTKKTLEPSRDFESTNGYRHLTLVKEDARLVFQTAPNGLAAEQFRLLRRTIIREFESGAVLLITSPAVGDGKTLTSVNLASSLAESGQPTLLVEADVRRPIIRHILGAEVEPPGVEDVLARNVEPRSAVHGIKELNLYATMVTRIPDNPAQLIGGPGVKHLLAWARENFLWVVLDAPPTLPTADVSELLSFADAAVLVIRAQSTPRELAKQAVDILGKHLRGVIFNEVTVASNPHYRYLNNYYYPQASDSKSEGLVKRAKSV